jgi:hypothetical protein
MRKSLVVYGVGQVVRSELTTGQEVPAIILAHAADNVAFAQIKGSFYKLKVKEFPSSADKSTGILCQCKLTKVTKEKIVGEFACFSKEDEKSKNSEKLAESAFKATWKVAKEDIK